MVCCGGQCLDTSRGGVACVGDAPCPSAGVCASAGGKATCCLFPGVCVGGRECCTARERVCGTKCCPEGYACLAGACAPAGCQAVEQGLALQPAAAAAAATEDQDSCTALVPPPPTLPKGLAVQFADPKAEAAASSERAAAAADADASRPYVRVDSAEACCALCASTPGCASYTHGAVVLAAGAGGGDSVADSVRSSCELWTENGGGGVGGPPANGEAGRRPGGADGGGAPPAPRLQSVPAPAWVTSGRVPRAAESGGAARIMTTAAADADAAAAAAAAAAPAAASAAAKALSTAVGGGLYGGAFDTHVGDYQGTAIKQSHAAPETPCARASDAVKAGGAGAQALYAALHPGVDGSPTYAQAGMTEEEYLAAAAALLGPAAATKAALEERFYAQRGRGLLQQRSSAGGGGGARQPRIARTPVRPENKTPSQTPQNKRSTSYTAAAAPVDPCGASLALMTSTWLAGGSLLPVTAASGGGASVGTVRACCELCAATAGCQFWTFSTPLASCWLRSGSAAAAAVAVAPTAAGGGGGGGGGGGTLASVPCRYSISGAMAGAPSPGLCAASLVCRGAPTPALPDGAASCCPAAGWLCSEAGVCCPPGSAPCGARCGGCPSGQACQSGACVSAQQPPPPPQVVAAAALPPQQQAVVQAQQPAGQSQLSQFQGQQPPGGFPSTFAGGGGGGGGGSGLVFGAGGGGNRPTYSADAPRFGYYGRAVIDGAALVTDPSDPQACRQRPAEGAAAFRFSRAIASNSGGALNRNAPVAQATAVDCCLACGGIGNCDAFSWDGASLACTFWTNKINGVAMQRLETPQKGAVVGDMIRALTFRADGTPAPRLDDACRNACGPTDGSRPTLCCVDGRETCLAPTGVGRAGTATSAAPTRACAAGGAGATRGASASGSTRRPRGRAARASACAAPCAARRGRCATPTAAAARPRATARGSSSSTRSRTGGGGTGAPGGTAASTAAWCRCPWAREPT